MSDGHKPLSLAEARHRVENLSARVNEISDEWFAYATRRNNRYFRMVVLRQSFKHKEQLDRIEAKLDELKAVVDHRPNP